MTRRGLQVTLTILGGVAVILGGVGVLTGGAGVLDGGKVSASVDSEMRFFAAWYVAGGMLMLRSVRRIETDIGVIRITCAAWLIAACGRVLSILVVGSPHPIFLVLMAFEFAIPIVVAPWLAAVTRTGGDGAGPT